MIIDGLIIVFAFGFGIILASVVWVIVIAKMDEAWHYEIEKKSGEMRKYRSLYYLHKPQARGE